MYYWVRSSAMSGLCLLGMIDDPVRWPGPSVTNANSCVLNSTKSHANQRTSCSAYQPMLSNLNLYRCMVIPQRW